MLSGEGAARYGGRWNPRGMRAVYCSENSSLAALEILVNLARPSTFAGYRVLDLDVPDGALVAAPAPTADARHTRQAGAELLRTHLALVAPSAVNPLERNVVINPAHPDFDKVRPRHDPALRLRPPSGSRVTGVVRLERRLRRISPSRAPVVMVARDSRARTPAPPRRRRRAPPRARRGHHPGAPKPAARGIDDQPVVDEPALRDHHGREIRAGAVGRARLHDAIQPGRHQQGEQPLALQRVGAETDRVGLAVRDPDHQHEESQ